MTRSNPFSIITRGPLIVRDVDVLAEAARRAQVSVTFSVPTLDDEVWRRTEPGTAPPAPAAAGAEDAGRRGHPRERRHGADPAGPLRQARSCSNEVVREAREAGACGVWANLLHLKPGTREHFLTALAEDYPEQLPAYERLYARRAYLGAAEAKPVRELVSDLTRKHGIRDRRTTRLEPDPEPEQLALSSRPAGAERSGAAPPRLPDRARRARRLRDHARDALRHAGPALAGHVGRAARGLRRTWDRVRSRTSRARPRHLPRRGGAG